MALARIQTQIIEALLNMEHISEEQAKELIHSKTELSGSALETILLEYHEVSEFQLLLAKCSAFDLSPFNAKNLILGERIFEKLEIEFCRNNRVLPVGLVGNYILIALADPFSLSVTNKIQEMTRMKVVPLLALESDIMVLLEEEKKEPTKVEFGDVVEALGMQFDSDDIDISEAELEEETAPIVQLANRIIEDSYFSGASDIHIEPLETTTRVRVRVDGICMERLSLPHNVATALMARLKIMANLDIAEMRRPQDGRIVFKGFNNKGIDLDLRISTAPLNHGEGVVMRLLDKQKSTLPLPDLGFSEENLEVYREMIRRPYGMILHCGPTGSGKSMTLYSALNEINSPRVCIRTAEDPIEYTLNGLCQMQMNRKIGLTFATALRAFLRQDPDIILVGEIRDVETARIAVEAALTGHMLFSTLHTNDAPSSVARLCDMGVEPFMISSSLIAVCSQRLMRRVCKICRQINEATGREKELLETGISWSGEVPHSKVGGCPSCGGTGYKGRVGIHELMTTSKDLVRGINENMESSKLKRIAVRNGMKTLHEDSFYKVKAGITTIQEAIATIPPDLEDLKIIREAKTLEEALIDRD